MSAQSAPMIHIRYEGQSIDVVASNLDIGDLSSDRDILSAVARHLNAPESKLRNFQVDRSDEGFTIRPQAVFG